MSVTSVARISRPAAWLPPVTAALAALTGLVNIASNYTPSLPDRVRVLLQLEPVEAVPLAHALVLPIGVALLILAFYLARRRRGAFTLAVLVLVALGVLDLIKGLDVEEALLSFGVAGFLFTKRHAFYVRHDPLALRTAVWRIPALLIGAFATAVAVVWAASDHTTPRVDLGGAIHEALALLTLSGRSLHYHHHFHWVPTGVELLGVATLLAIFYVVLRPLAGPRRLPAPPARTLAREIVERHGQDTLAYFKLRQDKHYLFSADRRAFLGFQIEGRTLLVSSDPVGPDAALPALLRDLLAYARQRGLKVGVINASERMRELGAAVGLRSFYFGDEAIVDVRKFSLEGRPIRKVRQSVTRLQKAGYTAEFVRVKDVDPRTRAEVRAVSRRDLGDEPERGFSMCMDEVCGAHHPDSALVIARDGEGAVRGFLHLVPSYGRPAMSLSAMRRDRDTPNGLMEFLICHGIESTRAEGVEHLSLNFAAFARWLHSPRNRRERLLGRAVHKLDRFFQVVSLYKFNAKFFPVWEPRYLLYEGRFGMLPTGIAALILEGQVPRPPLRRPPVGWQGAEPEPNAARGESDPVLVHAA